MPNIQKQLAIGIISGSGQERDYFKKEFSPFPVKVVYEGSSPSTNISNLGKISEVDIVLVCEGSPNTLPIDMNPSFPKIHKYAPNAKIILRTGLERNDLFVQRVREAGVSVVGIGLDPVDLIHVFGEVLAGEQVEQYESGRFGQIEDPIVMGRRRERL